MKFHFSYNSLIGYVPFLHLTIHIFSILFLRNKTNLTSPYHLDEEDSAPLKHNVRRAKKNFLSRFVFRFHIFQLIEHCQFPFRANTNDMKIKNPNGRSAKDGTSNYADVLIIGAGLAGLGSATKLQTAGLRYQILEAQSKAGGRVNTMDMKLNVEPTDSNENCATTKRRDDNIQVNDTQFVDTGAQWLHG